MSYDHKISPLGRVKGFASQCASVIVFLQQNVLGLSIMVRLYLLALYVKFTFKDLLLKRFLKRAIQRETFFTYTVYFSDYSSFRNLFIEIFILGQYYFKTAASNPSIIDCGANMGMSVLFFKFLYPNSRILAFEPDRDSFALLKANIGRNSLNHVTMRNTALLDKKGDAIFYVNISNSSVNTAVGAIFKKEDILIERVKSEMLSEFIHDTVDFLKIDVEGAEDIIMQELVEKNVLRLVKDMVIEYHPYLCKNIKTIEDFLSFLRNNNFNSTSKKCQQNYLVYSSNHRSFL